MVDRILNYPAGVTLLGGGYCDDAILTASLSLAPNLVCADGGANRLVAAGPSPDAIIGDLDSLEDIASWRSILADRLIHVAEQDSTDFAKCLSLVTAPFFIAVGFLGGRQDHTLAALDVLVADPRAIVMVGPEDVCFAAEGTVRLELPVGDRVSIFPMRPVTGRGGEGLEWPIDQLGMAVGQQIGTSNRMAATSAEFSFDQRGSVIFLEPNRLTEALAGRGVLFQPPI